MVTKVGNLRVYCNGKIFVGPDWKSLLISFLLIFLPSLLYLSLIAAEMGPDVFWFAFLLVVFNLTMLALTGLSNPGVIPRRPAPAGPNARLVPSTRTKDYKINGYTVSTKYCTTCQIYRVPRCSHCAVSDNCVEKFDHYCPWVGTCIGRRNYRFFLMFVFSGTALCLLVCATSLSRLVELSGDNNDEFDTAMKREPIAIILVIYTFGAIWFVGGLSVFHTYLVFTNQTTYEHIRRRFGQHGNPYDKGIFKNVFEACCHPNPPYDWESDTYQTQGSQETYRPVELPSGVVLNPTVIAMQQEAREQAERARANSHRGSDGGSCSHGGYTRENQVSLDYQDSLYSSSSSVEGRRQGMADLRSYQRTAAHGLQRNAVELEERLSDVAVDEIQEDVADISNVSLDHPSSKPSLAEMGSQRQTLSVVTSSGSREAAQRGSSQEKRLPRHHLSHKANRQTEPEMASVRASVRRTTNPFAHPEEHGGVDGGALEALTTLSSLTSNATSDVSSHRTDRSDLHSRKQDKLYRSRQRVMSMQEIMSSQRNIPDISLGSRRHAVYSERKLVSAGEVHPKTQSYGLTTDGLARLRSLRASGEQVFNNLKAFLKKQSKNSEDPQEEKSDVAMSAAAPVFIEIDNLDRETSVERQADVAPLPEKSFQEAAMMEEGHALRSWVPLSPLNQQKYTELKEAPPPPLEESGAADSPSEVRPNSPSNNLSSGTISARETVSDLKESLHAPASEHSHKESP